MLIETTLNRLKEYDIIPMSDLKLGELGIVVEEVEFFDYRETIVLGKYPDGYVSLSKKIGTVWGSTCPLKVRRLLPGEIVTIYVK